MVRNIVPLYKGGLTCSYTDNENNPSILKKRENLFGDLETVFENNMNRSNFKRQVCTCLSHQLIF
jgi:hypothetical protein